MAENFTIVSMMGLLDGISSNTASKVRNGGSVNSLF